MAALKELKERIASVQSTLKITSAMKMVASAKLLRVQSSMEALAEYERRFSDIVAALVSDPDVEVASPLTLDHGEKRRACLVALASDSSLCGSFNANALREAVAAVEELLAEGFSRVTVYPIGEKMVQGMNRYVAAYGKNRQSARPVPPAQAVMPVLPPGRRCLLVRWMSVRISAFWSENTHLTG